VGHSSELIRFSEKHPISLVNFRTKEFWDETSLSAKFFDPDRQHGFAGAGRPEQD
jgi:hypothetical protein